MPSYLVAEMKLKETDWMNDYLSVVPDIVKKHSGVYIFQALEIERVEGTRGNPDVVVIILFPSKEEAQGFLTDPDYQPYSAARRKGTDSEVMLVPWIESLVTTVGD